MIELHSCSYFCERPDCIKTQRDELLSESQVLVARVRELEQERNELERELTALKRGEFICQKCMLRKDGEHDTKHEF